MQVTAFHIVETLTSGLYKDHGRCLIELLRNSVVASMPDPHVWDPKRAKIDVFIDKNHPLCPDRGPALVIRDYACGLTEPNLDRYFNWMGTPISKLREHSEGSYGGASQKGVGRLAALALNKKAVKGKIMERIKHGYYLFTRTSHEGPVRFVSVIPQKFEEDGGFKIDRFISPNSTELGSLKNIKGSFTAIVIPNPVFDTEEEILKSVQWHLPREQDKMFDLTIGGKKVCAPPLETKLTIVSVDGVYRARLGVGDATSDGVWICDEKTGFRVASCQRLSSILPDPLWYNDLVGDIFVPNVLKYQDSSREALHREFTSRDNPELKKLQMFLIREVVTPAKKLIERDAIGGSAADTLDELTEMFVSKYGLPEVLHREKNPPVTTIHTTDIPPRTHVPKTPEEKEKDKYRRHVVIKVKNDTFVLYRGQSLHPNIFAQVNPNNSQMIFVNVRGGYTSLPKHKQARTEHCLMQILSAIGHSKFPSDQYEATIFANQIREEFMK